MVTVNLDVIGIKATGSLEKCGKMDFEIVSSTDDFETTKNGIDPTVTAISPSIDNLKKYSSVQSFFNHELPFLKFWG